MSSTTLNTPRYGRRASASSLDFVFWAMESVDANHPRNIASQVFEGMPKDEHESISLIAESAAQTGIAVTQDFDSFMRHVRTYDTSIDIAFALHTRGALLIKNRGVGISLGDGKRIIEAVNNLYVCRYLNRSELLASFWDSAATIPGMVYL